MRCNVLSRRARWLLLTVAGVAGLGALATAVDIPVGGDELLLKDGAPAKRRVFFRAARDPRIVPSADADPRTLGATLQIVGLDADDGRVGPILLPAEGWKGIGRPPGSKGFRYRDPGTSNGIRSVLLKSGSRGGSLIINGRGAGWSYAVDGPQGPIEVRFVIGDSVYCARFTRFAHNGGRRVVARNGSAPLSCDAPPEAVCGDGLQERAEECDDGNVAPGDACSADCRRENTRCGDGVAGGAEECDDGNTTSGDGCTAECQLESTAAICAGVPTVPNGLLATTLVASGLANPTAITAPPLDPHRLFIVEQGGRIRILKNGGLLATPFLSIESRVRSAGEEGLLSLAFHPAYEQNGFFFVYYTRPDRSIVIARYRVTANPDVADSANEHVIVTIPHPLAENHNGGQLAFNPADGHLYAGPGDGGGGCDPESNSQNDASRLGKLLRIDVDVEPETIETWAKGLRNPYRFSFDRLTHDLYIGDVGQNKWEEVDVDPAPVEQGVNYGWDRYEGRECSNAASACNDPCPDASGFTMPIHQYDNPPGGCSQSITGGYVYRGCRMRSLQGTYFFADYCEGVIQSLVYAGGLATNVTDLTVELRPLGGQTLNAISTFGEDARGELFVADYDDGNVYQIIAAP